MELDRVIAVRTGKTVYRNGDKCVKVFGEGYSAAEVLCEAANHARAAEAKLPVPELYAALKTDNKWMIVSEYIKGKTFETLMKQYPERREELLGRFVNLQMTVFSKPGAALPSLRERLEKGIERADADEATRFELLARLRATPRQNKFCHGHFTLSNVVAGDDGRDYLLDFSRVSSGNAAADVAFTYLSFLFKKQTVTAERYLDVYCKKSGEARGYVLRFAILTAAALSADANEEKREFYRSYVRAAEKLP
ncbi:MAG: phosphotransferase [Candidatus Borkfalkiaceae bacterium]|nr:phosphotransferase [Clostridia bacterium]MDY6224054.1 phosphotransferase [Christensenellaceae bacterium]